MNPKMMTCKIMDGNRKDVPMVNPIIVARPLIHVFFLGLMPAHRNDMHVDGHQIIAVS